MPAALPAKSLRDDVISAGNLHVWRVDLAADQQVGKVAESLPLLSMAERRRAAQFLREAPHRNYILRRGILRRLLATYLQRHPGEIEIETTGYGKPYLAAPADSWLCFNVAHSGAQVLVAIGGNRRIGVDIERRRGDLDHDTIARNYFAAEERAELAQLPRRDRLTAFFDCWARKEAYLKAIGSGLAAPPDSFVVSAKPNAGHSINPDAPSALLKLAGDTAAAAGWTLRDIPTPPGYAAAIAAEGNSLAVQCINDFPAVPGSEFRPRITRTRDRIV